jgi:preprotein translocase subunit SecG
MFIFLLILLIIDSLVLVGVVLLQAGQGGGLAAMGGGASTDTFLGGRQAVTILTKMSWWCGGIFLALSLVLAGLSARGTRMRSVLEGQIQAPAPVSPLPLNVQPVIPGTTTPTPGPSTTTPPKPAGPN